MQQFRNSADNERQVAQAMMYQGLYLDLNSLFALLPDQRPYWRIITQISDPSVRDAAGSSHNHQAWKGGYLDHVVETMNIACQQYVWMSRVRTLPFELHEALEVMFLHDLEKPWKYGMGWKFKGKEARKEFRAQKIKEFGIELTEEQENALKYVEGVPDSEYTPGERTMGELAAFCHCCDILSARLWHDKGQNVRFGHQRWE